MPRSWGGVARRGAGQVRRSDEERGADAQVVDRPRGGRPAPVDEWVRTDGTQGDGGSGTPRRLRVGPPPPVPDEVAAQIRVAASAATAHHRELLVRRAAEAVEALEHGRNQEAYRTGKSVADEAPEVAAVRWVVGLAAYRAGRWRDAVAHLEAHAALTGESQGLPLIMDSYRALGRRSKVATLWGDVRRRSPDPDTLAEARIVAAATVADRGDLAGAISLLAAAGAGKALRNPGERHLRQWFALADLYERAGDVPRARELFARVQAAEPDAFGVEARLEALGRGTGRRGRPGGRGTGRAPAGSRRRPPAGRVGEGGGPPA